MVDSRTGPIAEASVTTEATPEQVWRTLTDPRLVREYLFGATVNTDWRVGGTVTYSGEWDGEPYEDRGVVVEAVRPRLLVTSFFRPPADGQARRERNVQTVSYRVEQLAAGSRVSVSQDSNADAAAAAQSSASWQVILDSLARVAPRA